MSKGKNTSRHGARALAFQVLYGLNFSPVQNAAELRASYFASPDVRDSAEQGVDVNPDEEPQGFAWELIFGTWTKQQALDKKIEELAKNWRLERIGKIELTILRLAVYEMLYRDDVPAKVAINEALELSKQFGDENARGFVNGILDAAAKALDDGSLQRA